MLLRRARSFVLSLVVVCTLSQSARAADPDPWIAQDKALHFGASATLAVTGYGVGAYLFPARAHALLVGGGVAAAAGIAKETMDLAGFGHPSWKDVAWDGIGIATGLALSWGLDLLIRGVSERHPLLGSPAPLVF